MQAVTVGRRSGGQFGADGAVGAGAVVDHDLLFQRVTELGGEDACHQISGAAGREADDDADGPDRVVLRSGKAGGQCQ